MTYCLGKAERKPTSAAAPDLAKSQVRRPFCAPSAIRTRALLLRRHFRPVAGRRWVAPDVLFSCTDNRWAWPSVAWHLSLLAPRLAPRDPVSLAHVRRLRPPLISPATAGAGSYHHAP